MMEEAEGGQPRKRRPFRTIVWVMVGGIFLFVATNLLFPDLDFSGRDQIAVVRVEGTIIDSKETVGDITRFAQNPLVKAIVLRIDSPGGAVVPSQEIHDAVLRAKSKYQKTIIASMGTLAASGGYYIAAATDLIVANPGTLTGSIGVIMELANVEGLLKKVGVESVVIKSGRFKDLASPLRTMGKEEQSILQSVIDDVHDQFIHAVAEGRSLSVEEVRVLADGRIFTGRQAKELKLVDELGNLDDAVHMAATLAGIEDEPKVVEPQRPFSIRDILESRFLGVLPKMVFQPGISLKYLMAL